MIKQLGLDKYNNQLIIIIDNNLDDGNGNPCNALATNDNGRFIIALKGCSNNKLALEQSGITLAHELVHIKQMLNGKLNMNNDGFIMWCGKQFSNDYDYLSRPWEIMAFAQQEIIFRKCFVMSGV